MPSLSPPALCFVLCALRLLLFDMQLRCAMVELSDQAESMVAAQSGTDPVEWVQVSMGINEQGRGRLALGAWRFLRT